MTPVMQTAIALLLVTLAVLYLCGYAVRFYRRLKKNESLCRGCCVRKREKKVQVELPPRRDAVER